MTHFRFDAVLHVGSRDASVQPIEIASLSRYGERPGSRFSRDLGATLLSHAETRLPGYMVPSNIVMLDALPLTPSGKIDRRRLPAPDSGASPAESYAAPRTSLEEQVAAIWAEVLGVANPGIHDDFFRLGGHSLLAVTIISQARRRLGVDVSLKDLFNAPTVAGFAECLGSARARSIDADAIPAIVPYPSDRYEPFPLTEIQQAYWLGRGDSFELGNVATHSYIELKCRDLALDRLGRAWQTLIERHDMLRMAVLPTGQQRVLAIEAPYRIAVTDLGDADPVARTHALLNIRERMSHQVLPADRGPLFEVHASLVGDATTILHISFDALVSDAWGTRVLARELLDLYHHPDKAHVALDLSFRDYVIAEQQWQSTEWYRDAHAYWMERLSTLPAPPDLPLAAEPAALKTPRFKRRHGELEQNEWQRLKTLAADHAITPSSLLLSVFAEVLGVWARDSRFTLNLTLFNRLPAHDQVNDIVGDFTSLMLLEVDQRRRRAIPRPRPAPAGAALARSRPPPRQRCDRASRAGTGPGPARRHASRLHQHADVAVRPGG